jgi:hypothetical protein
VNINPFQDMRAVILCFYNKRLSESRAIEENQENPMGAGWTAYHKALIYFAVNNHMYLILEDAVSLRKS